jgi:hypothetical protein
VQAEVQAEEQVRDVMVIGDSFTSANLLTNEVIVHTYGKDDGVPTPDELANVDVAIVHGPLTNEHRALELAGAISLALERGATIVFGYAPPQLTEVDQKVLIHFVGSFQPVPFQSLRPAARSPMPHPAFREYVTLHGQTQLGFRDLPDGAEPLAHALETSEPCVTLPCAFAYSVAAGLVYVVGCHTAGTERQMTLRLVEAVTAHAEGSLARTPAFFDEIRLPGEPDLIDQIAATEVELADLRNRKDDLTRHKTLVGHLRDQALEAVVIDELNVVLDGSGWRAEDIEERYGEDFRLMNDGLEAAIGESKAAAGSVTAMHVAKVNGHRAERVDAGEDVENLPGLLVVNVFRNDDALGRRRDDRVDSKVVRSARRSNVLVLRTWDLYELVARRLSGGDDSAELIRAITDGGGWLEVTPEGPTLHGAEQRRNGAGS